MDRLQRAAILTELMDQLRKNQSWCGETHVQKAVYFLQQLLKVPTGFAFILYKYGPYSFDLSEDLMALQADYLIQLDHRSPGYGPALVPTLNSRELRSRYPKTLSQYRQPIEFIARRFGAKGVADLERLATALYVTQELGDDADVLARARRLHELKPHVSSDDAQVAMGELDSIVKEARDIFTETNPCLTTSA